MTTNARLTVENYDYLDEAVIVDSNGSKYAVGEDDYGYLNVILGEVYRNDEEDEDRFWAYESEKQTYTQIPRGKLAEAIEQL